jgi:hypothetical protein
MSETREITYALDFCDPTQRRRRGGKLPPDSEAADCVIPRIARLVALAIRFEGLVREEKIGDYAELAREGRVTRARMSQIMKLALLAPDIQEQLLFLPPVKKLNEKNLRPIVSLIDWDEQRLLFHQMMTHLAM